MLNDPRYVNVKPSAQGEVPASRRQCPRGRQSLDMRAVLGEASPSSGHRWALLRGSPSPGRRDSAPDAQKHAFTMMRGAQVTSPSSPTFFSFLSFPFLSSSSHFLSPCLDLYTLLQSHPTKQQGLLLYKVKSLLRVIMVQRGRILHYLEPEGLDDDGTSPDKPGVIVKKLEEWKGFSLVLAAVGQERRLEIHDAAHGGLLAWTPLQAGVSEDIREVPVGDVTLYRVSARACDLNTGLPSRTAPRNKRTQTDGDDNADNKKVEDDNNAMAAPEKKAKATASQAPSKKIKASHDEGEDTLMTPWKASPATAAQGIKPKSSDKTEEIEYPGFVYSVPLCGLFTYPPELIKALGCFADEHSFDLLPTNEIVLATHLWMDIQASPNLALETFTETGQPPAPVPNISLACMILLYGHWLRWTHSMQLAEHPHPFRWMWKACHGHSEEGELSTSNIYNLDEEKIKALMDGVTTTVPGVDMSYRVRVSPCCMPGASGGHLHNSVGTEEPSRVALALTGLSSVQLMGLQSYEPPKQWITDHQLKTVSWPKSLDNLVGASPQYVCSGEQATQIETPKTMIPTWSTVTGVGGCWGFAPMPLPKASALPGPVVVKMKKAMPPAEYREYLRRTRIHLYKAACFMRDRATRYVTYDAEFGVMPIGMPPLTAADLSMSAPKKFVFVDLTGVSDEGGLPTGEAHEGGFGKEPGEERWKSPAGNVGLEAYDELLALWTAIPHGCHCLWYTGLEKLKAAKRENATVEDLLLLVGQITRRQAQDSHFIADIKTKAQEGFFPSGKQLSYELPTAFGRYLGIDAGRLAKDTPDLWDKIYIPLARRDLVRVVLDISRLLHHLQVLQATEPAADRTRRSERMGVVQRTFENVVLGMYQATSGEAGWLMDWKRLACQYSMMRWEWKKD